MLEASKSIHIKEVISDINNSFKSFDWDIACENSQQSQLNLVSTGFPELDEYMDGGFYPSDLIMLASRPAMGKSALALNIANNIAMNKKPVLFFSLDMSKENVTKAIISQLSGISLYTFNSPVFTKAAEQQFAKAAEILSGIPLYINDSPRLTPVMVRNEITKLISEKKDIGAVFIDYLQLMENFIDQTQIESKVEDFFKIAVELKKIVKDLKVPVIVLSQLPASIDLKIDPRPLLNDFIPAFIGIFDVVMFLYRDEYYNTGTEKKKIAEIIIAKHHSLSNDVVELKFDSTTTRFTNSKVI